MNPQDIQRLVTDQQTFFQTGATLDPAWRVERLKALKNAILSSEESINAALKADLGKSGFESYMCEVGMALSELSWMIRQTPRLARERRAATPLAQFPSRSFQKPSPYGTALIMSPWNYPFLLTIDPLVDAVAAGNTVILKPSAYAPHTAQVLAQLVERCFDPSHVAVVTGGRAENACLLEQPFDYIFFTGSQAVGKEVLRHAAQRLTPVTLELGGKSPCIVDRTADLALAARRIVFGKFLNCGQTCVAPDYILCHEAVKDQFTAQLKAQVTAQFGPHPLENGDYGRIVNEKHFDRLLGLMDPAKTVLGGGSDRAALRIEPTILSDVAWTDPVMGEEIFGPILPILTYKDAEQVIAKLHTLPKPLAFYVFSSDSAAVKALTARCSFGGGCVNDVIIHLATTQLPFGGVGESGMGSYHGKAGFETFSHLKSIVDKKTWLDLPMRYQPYDAAKEKLVRFFLK